MNIFFVSTPLQYLCAKEAKSHYNTLGNILLVKLSNNKTEQLGRQQILELIDDKEWDYVFIVKRSAFLPFLIKKLNSKFLFFDRVFFSDYVGWYSAVLLNNVSFNSCVYIDDGVMTIFQYEELIKFGKALPKVKKGYNFLLFISFLRRVKHVGGYRGIEIFTIFNITEPNCKVESNNLSLLRGRIKNGVYNESSPIAFIGDGGVSEDTIPEQIYLERLMAVASKDKDVIYFPHRTESSDLKDKVLSLNNVYYHDSRSPIEVEILNGNLKFSRLVGFGSTALYTLSILDENLPVSFLSVGVDNYYTNKLEIMREHYLQQFQRLEC